MKYTELELKVIEAIGGVLNYDKLEDNINDNATGLEIEETCELTGLNAKQVRGVFSSLEQKGLMYLEVLNMGTTRYMQVTELGLREYYRLFVEKESNDMVKVIERATGTEFKANKIEGGYEVFTLAGEKYKKLKDSTFKKYFKLTGDTVEPKPEKEEKKQEKEAPQQKSPKAEKAPKDDKKPIEPKKELSQEDREAMIDKIRKILNLSENNPSQEEGIAAALKAQKLMAEYRITQDEVSLEEIDPNEIVSMATELKHNSGLHTWRKGLASVISKNFCVKCYTDQNKDITFRGFKEDTEIAKEVFTYLYVLGNKLGSKAYHEALAKGSGKGVYNEFTLGFLHGVEDALNEQCVALMVVTPKAVEEEFEKFSQENLKTTTTTLKTRKGETYEKGKKEGKAAVKSRQLAKKGDK